MPRTYVYTLALFVYALPLLLPLRETTIETIPIADCHPSLPMRLLLLEIPLVLYPSLLYYPLPLSQTLSEFPFVDYPLFPFVCPHPMRTTLFKASLEEVAIGELFLSHPML